LERRCGSRLEEKATALRDDPEEQMKVLGMMRQLKTADNDVAGWRQLLAEILQTDRVDLEGFVTARRDKVTQHTAREHKARQLAVCASRVRADDFWKQPSSILPAAAGRHPRAFAAPYCGHPSSEHSVGVGEGDSERRCLAAVDGMTALVKYGPHAPV
jgi:hypothetical protein